MSIYLEEFETLYGISDNIEKLRSKILDYAFKGKLIKNNKSEKSAKDLVKSIRKSRKEMIENKEIRKPRGGVDSVDLDKAPHSIPDYWEWDKIGYIFNIYNGDSINRKLKERKYMKVKEGYDYIGTKDVGYHGEINYKTDVKIPFDEKDDFSIAPPNRPLICCEGGSAGKKIGFTDKNISFGNKLFAVESFGDFNYKFLFYYYQSNTFYEQFNSKLKGVIGGVSMGRFREIFLPIPPLEEQKIIVDKIEKLMKEVDKLETKLKEKESISKKLSVSIVEAQKNSQDAEELKENLRFIIDNFDIIFKTSESMDEMKNIVLQLAIEGNLLPQDESDEPASELIKKIKKEKEFKFPNNLKEEYKNSVFTNIPAKWELIKLGLIGNWGAGATPKRDNPEYWGGSIPWLKTGELNNGIITESEEFITKKALEKTSVRINKPGDILIAMYGATIGKLGILEFEATTNQACCACSTYEGVFNKYLFYFLMGYRQELVKSGAGGAQPNISKTKIINIDFPLPPFEEQKRIVKKVDSIMNIIDKLEKELEKREDLVEKLGTI